MMAIAAAAAVVFFWDAGAFAELKRAKPDPFLPQIRHFALSCVFGTGATDAPC